MLRRIAVLAIAVLVVAALIAWYVVGYLLVSPATVSLPSANLTLQTVAGLGNGYTEPTWVSYLVRDEQGRWQHTTIFKVPANSVVHVTVYQYDGDSGLRNAFLARAQGVVGNVETVDGKTVDSINPDDASHTFAVAAYGLVVPLPGVADDAKNQCEQAPCGLDKAHRTITFSFRTGAPGHYRWQCFVPCAAGFIYGFGGPMQTVGYMDGFLDVV
ncbi:MAG TPA: hypothetical protein VMT59_09055 [Gaiellaceae bacterium]|nr:hypothetical protein [Gaiellaceae bacterium]